MRGALGGPRVLLRRLREVMAEPVSAQERLDKIVVLIAANMVAEVCSVYVLRVDGTLELYATEGLNKAAVHQTVLRSDEGLVGLVASEANPVNLSEAQNHPAFSYRIETGEEIYHSFLGVPVVNIGTRQGGRDRGCNVFDVDYDRRQIVHAIERHLNNGRYPQDLLYGDGHAGVRIAALLSTEPLVIEKRLPY